MSFYELPGGWPLHQVSSWSKPLVMIVTAPDPQELTDEINRVLDDPDVHALAVSAATTTATFVEEPWTCTLIVQERIDPNDASPR